MLAAVGVMLALTASAFAQGTRGTIRGTVSDPNGAAVAGATARLFDIAKGQEVRSTTTNEDGVYQFVEVDPATYNIVISATGFSEARLSEVKVEPNRNLQLDVALTVGAATEEVTVTGTSELLDRETPTLGTTVDPRRVRDLPLNGRNVLDLAQLQPGVVAPVTAGGSGFRVHGQRAVENNITLDGSNNNEIAVGGATGAQPRPDAVQEFRILTSNYEAEFGRNTGSVVNVVANSGTRDFHGNLRFFYRPTFLSAARFFDNALATQPLRKVGECPANRAERTRENCDYRRIFERKEYGGNIGGPIYLPKFGEGGKPYWSGRDNAFFFFDWEGRHQIIGDTRTITNLPTPAQRAGDFSALLPGRVLTDPATGQPFPGNIIPQARFANDPIVRYYLGFLPEADATGTARAGANQLTDNTYLTTRVDVLATGAQSLNFTFNRFNTIVDEPFAFGGSQVPGFGSFDLRRTYNFVARHTYAFSPTMVNTFLAGYARNGQPAVFPQNQTTPSEIGFARSDFVAIPGFAGPPVIRLFDRGDLRIGNTVQGPQARITENFQLQNSLSWVKGDHRFKFGVDGTKYHGQQTFAFINNGGILFSRNFNANSSGDDFADFLLGNPSFVQIGNSGDLDFRQFGGAAFAQDAWRFSDTLTLSLGLRWEYTGGISDKYDRIVFYRPGSDVVSQRLLSGDIRNATNGQVVTVPAGGRAPRGVLYVGDPDPVLGTVPRSGVGKDLNNFAPRVGFAWAPSFGEGTTLRSVLGDRQTVFRAGFGVYYGAIVGDVALQQLGAPGFGTLVTQVFTEGAGTTANPFGPDPFPNFCRGAGCIRNGTPIQNPLTAPPTLSAPLAAFPLLVVDPNLRTPYTLQWNGTIERGFARDYVLTLSYVGNRGRKLYGQEQVNPALGTNFFPFAANDPRRPGGATPVNVIGSTANQRRLNDDVRSSITMQVSASNSAYDAFEAQVQKRYSNGLLFQAAYTWSKSINEAESIRGGLDRLDRRAGRGLSDDDRPHAFVGSFIYDLPFFKNTGNGFLRRALGGFSIGGIATFQSGTPFSVFNNFDETVGSGGIVSFADLGPNGFQQADPHTQDRRAFNVNAFRSFCDPAAVVPATCARRGTTGRNQFRLGNDINNFDFIFSKKTQLWSESTYLELRFEAFNAFNHTQFTTVNANLNNVVLNADGTPDPVRSGFGRFTAARESRVIQLGARLQF
ncbi:MAG TPA: TonB-dependent receptor [Pyrinomonadaceae bacterium]|nr:TonB-dependent receptor [Pyrinomonadaceae bacterium]